MRYLIAETSWNAMRLSRELQDRGVLVSQTDRAEDVAHFVSVAGADLLVADSALMAQADITLRALRDLRPDMPVVLVEAAPESERVATLLTAGADMVLDTATPPGEICARLLALVRRAHGLAENRLTLGPLCLDLEARQARVDGAALALTPKVYEMLEYMALRAGRLVTRDALLNHVYGLEQEPESRVFDVYLCTLRGRLRDSGSGVSIQTARGTGFRLLPPDSAPDRRAA